MSLQDQIDELNRLLELANVPDVRKLLTDAKNAAIAKKLQEEENEKGKSVTASVDVEKSNTIISSSVVADSAQIGASTQSTAVSTKPVIAPTVGAGSSYYHPIDSFSWDQGDSHSALITVYVDLDDVGNLDKSQVQCNFTKDSFVLSVEGLNNKNYKLVQDNLEHYIQPDICSYIIKKNKVVVKLKKAKSDNEYSPYERWNNLLSRKSREQKEADLKKKKDPSTALQSMLKDMYDDGDDKMKALIGEAMLKGQQGGGGGLPKKAGSSLDDLDFNDV